MKKSGLFSIIVLIMTALAVMTGCGYTEEEKALMKEYEKTGKENAVNYIKEKYGFNADVTEIRVLKVNPGPVPDFSPAPNGKVMVSMKNDGRDFSVEITGEEISTEGEDDYQKPEIEAALKEQLEREMALKIEAVDAKYCNDCLIHDRFTDIGSFIVGLKGNSIVDIIVMTFDEVSERTVMQTNYDNAELLVISCRNQSAFNLLSGYDYIKKHDYRMNFYNMEALDNKLLEYSIFMNGYVYKSMEGKVATSDYELEKPEDGVYLVYDRNGCFRSPKVTESSDMAPASDWSRASGKAKEYPTFENPEKKSKSYGIDFGDCDRVQIFMMQEDRKADDKAQRYISLQYVDENGNEVFTHIAPRLVEKLYSFKLEREDSMRFAVMINKK